MSLSDDNFVPYEIFDEEFGHRLTQVNENVLMEWPRLRDDNNYNVLQMFEAALLDLPNIHELVRFAIYLKYST